jgi:hypothetical protein
MTSIHRSALAVLSLSILIAACGPDGRTPASVEPAAPRFDSGMVGPADRSDDGSGGVVTTSSDTTTTLRNGMVGPSD